MHYIHCSQVLTGADENFHIEFKRMGVQINCFLTGLGSVQVPIYQFGNTAMALSAISKIRRFFVGAKGSDPSERARRLDENVTELFVFQLCYPAVYLNLGLQREVHARCTTEYYIIYCSTVH